MATLCKLSGKGTERIHQVNLFRSLFEIFVLGTFIYATYKSGDIEFLQVRDIEDDESVKLILTRKSTILSGLSDRH